jgi:hypothetical protein
MNTISAFNASLNGIYKGKQSLNQNAATIASSAAIGNTADTTRAVVGLVSDENQIKASIKALKTADETIGTLLDMKV